MIDRQHFIGWCDDLSALQIAYGPLDRIPSILHYSSDTTDEEGIKRSLIASWSDSASLGAWAAIMWR